MEVNFICRTLTKPKLSLSGDYPAGSEYFYQSRTNPDLHRSVLGTLFSRSYAEYKKLVNAATPIVSFNVSAFAAAMTLGAPIAGPFALLNQHSFWRVR